MLYDLTLAILRLTETNSRDRQTKASYELPSVGVVALNGIPFVGEPPTYFGVSVTPESIHEQLRLGLGFGGVLTYMNSKDMSLHQLSDMSLLKGHDWAMHSIHVTLCFAGADTFTEMSFARDRRFHLSWVDSTNREDWVLPRLFTASASWKDWRAFLKHRDSTDFQSSVRVWMHKAHEELHAIFPEYML